MRGCERRSQSLCRGWRIGCRCRLRSRGCVRGAPRCCGRRGGCACGTEIVNDTDADPIQREVAAVITRNICDPHLKAGVGQLGNCPGVLPGIEGPAQEIGLFCIRQSWRHLPGRPRYAAIPGE